MFWAIGVGSAAIILILGWRYCHNLDWQIKFLTVRLNKAISCSRRDGHGAQPLLKKIYVIINKGMADNHSAAVYQTLELLKLAFGYGLVGFGESTRLMAIGIRALSSKKFDIVGLVIDAFRPLVRQLPPEGVIIAVNQLTLLGVIALKKKQNFLTAKAVDCILFIMEQNNGKDERKVVVAAIKGLKILGLRSLRRRDLDLFREINKRLSSWFIARPAADGINAEIANILMAWLHRSVWLNEMVLFSVIRDAISNLVKAQAFDEKGIEIIIEGLGDVAASASLNPNSPIASLILTFMFELGNERKSKELYLRIIAIAGRVAKLAIHRHGLVPSFAILHPLLEYGRKLLWEELNFIEWADENRQQLLFRVVRENLILLTYAARQNLLGSTGESIVDIFKCWIGYSEVIIQPKSVKKYCQLLLLFWLKNKRQAKKYMPCDAEFTEPILFSNREKQRLGI